MKRGNWYGLERINITQKLIHNLFHISPGIIPRRSRGLIAGMIWKRSCINLFIIYFRQFNCVFNRYIFRTLYPTNINGNITYEGILKHRKYRRCDSLVSFLILFTVNREEDIARESFSFKIIFHSTWYNHLSSNVSMIFI
jgi:hypothetical protein